jgi:dihydroxyacetone kinase
MSDLEDVLSYLHKFKKSLKEQIEFVEKLESLFGTLSASFDMGGESISLESLNNLIDKKLIHDKI